MEKGHSVAILLLNKWKLPKYDSLVASYLELALLNTQIESTLKDTCKI